MHNVSRVSNLFLCTTGFKEIFKEVVQFCDVRQELTPDERETKEKFWNDNNAQILLRSLARLRKVHELVCRDDIDDDLDDAVGGELPKTTLADLLQKFCDKSLISKKKGTNEAGMWQYCIPKIECLVPFMNPGMGDMPDTEEEESDDFSDDVDCESAPSGFGKQIESAVLSEENAVIGAKADSSKESSEMPVPISIDTKRPSQKKAHSHEKAISLQKGENCPTETSEHLTNVDDVPLGTYSKRGTIEPQPHKRRLIYYTDKGDTAYKIARKYKVDVNQIIRDNRRRKKFNNISKHASFLLNSPIVLPMNNDSNSFLGSIVSPIEILESSDESSVSSVSMSFGSNSTCQKKKCKVISPEKDGDLLSLVGSEHLTNVDDVPMGTDSVRGTIEPQLDKRRRVYYTDKGDTAYKIAEKYEVDVNQIIRDNKRRENFENISKHASFLLNSPIVLPMM